MLRQLVGGGTTLILTTQYLEEANTLADHVDLPDHRRERLDRVPRRTQARHGGERVVVTVDGADDLGPAGGGTRKVAACTAEIDREGLFVTAPASESTGVIEVVRALEDGGVDAHDVRRREATLDDVFFPLTSPRARAESTPSTKTKTNTDREEAAG